jgi:hypothetical protein
MSEPLDLSEEYFLSAAAEAYERLSEGGMLATGRISSPLELYAAYEFDMRDVVTLLIGGEDIEAPIIRGIVLGWARRFGKAHPNPRRREMWQWLAQLPRKELRRVLEQAAFVEGE